MLHKVVGREFKHTAPGWGLLHIRNKRPDTDQLIPPSKIVIFQHGATYGSEAFDVPCGGFSWMDYLAARGFDCYAFDLPGYGRSIRPPQMDEPAESSPPFMRTSDAAQCLGAVVDLVNEITWSRAACLVGWSWGTAIAGLYTQMNPDRVLKLVLYAPVWDRREPGTSPIHVAGKLGAYRTVDREATLKRRLAGLTDEQKAGLIPDGWFDQWWEAVAASDPKGGGRTIRAPNGVVQDALEYWEKGRPIYDPAAIAAPLLITVGEWDNDTPTYMAQTLFSLCTNARWKSLSILGGGTHAMLMEHKRMLLFSAVHHFLEQLPPSERDVR